MKNAAFILALIFINQISYSQEVKDSLRFPINAITEIKFHTVNYQASKSTSTIDSLLIDIPGDSASQLVLKKADIIRSSFQSKVDSIHSHYRKPLDAIDAEGKKLQNKIDSLHLLKLLSNNLTSKLDSVNAARTTKIAEMNQKIENVKEKANKDLNALELPPQMKEPVQKLRQSINGYKIPVVNGRIPSFDASTKLPGFKLPDVNLNSVYPGKLNVSGVSGPGGITSGAAQINGPTGEILKVGGQAKEYAGDIKKIKQGKIPDVKTIDKEAEKQVLKNAPVGDFNSKTGELDKYKKQLTGRPDSMAMGMAKQEVMKEAKNHFKGQEAALQGAMDELSKAKKKYGDVKDVQDALRKKMNPLHDTPFIERIIPAIGFQILSSGAFLLDANASVSYRISPKFTAGAGWVQRFNFADSKTDRDVFGPRLSFQFNMPKGFGARFLPEVLNTFVPPQFSGNPNDAQRQWVASVFVGLKKDFKVSRRLKGYTEALYNLYNPERKSPYQDPLVVRFGFEFWMKKSR